MLVYIIFLFTSLTPLAGADDGSMAAARNTIDSAVNAINLANSIVEENRSAEDLALGNFLVQYNLITIDKALILKKFDSW